LAGAASLSAQLSPLCIHLWSIRTNAPEAIARGFEQLLAADEKSRATRFRFDRLRRSFTVSRGALRIILSFYLNAPPGNIEFTYGVNGKPAVASEAGLQFNASHSGDLALIAVTTGCELGVDLERMREIRDSEQIASRFFCPAEANELLSLPRDQQERAFFLCWTRKEAFIKATGQGLSAALDSFRVTLDPSQPAAILHIDGDRNLAQSWTLHDLYVAPGYAAALAYCAVQRPITASPILDPAELLRSI
jgi:4'-phosphopantetheinyl transferase